jgi:neutral ceramidase
MVFGFVSRPTEKQNKCHHPKPIMLNTGAASEPYDWDPKSIPISIFKVGKLFILNVPMEMTTMAGRRLREAVADIAVSKGVIDPIITIAGLANSYTHYVATFEEYQGQRYEAASTLFGPHTLSAYIQEFKRITTDMLNDEPSTSADAPTDLTNKQISLIPPVIVDTIAFGRHFGSVVEAPRDHYNIGQDTVFASFRSANPRNNRRPQGTFLTVDTLLDDGSWQTRFVDGDWCTKYVWNGEESMLGISFAEIYWEIPAETSPGLYRICHYGARKKLFFEVEALAFWSPNWMSVNAFGSAFAGFIVSGIKLYASLCKRMNWCRFPLETSRIKEFSGCSDPFHVKDGNSTVV